jgi:teichoic acid transport system permease protein
MYRTLKHLIKDYLQYFSTAVLVGFYRFKNSGEGRAMGLFWEFAKPLVFSLFIGFALSIGLRNVKNDEAMMPYLVWLFAGYFAWNFMNSTLKWGPKVFTKHRKMAQQQTIPLTLFPFVSLVKPTIIFCTFLLMTVVLGVIFGVGPFLAWLQAPVLVLLLIAYWYFFALFTGTIGTLSKDFDMFIGILSQPLFWTSGIIFNVSNINMPIFKVYLMINPVAFFATAFRRVIHDGDWVFADANLIAPFAGVFIVTMLLALVAYHKLKLEIRNEIR